MSAWVESKPAGNADDEALNLRAGEPLHQAMHLNVVGFVAMRVPFPRVVRDVGKAFQRAKKRRGFRRLKLKRNAADFAQAFFVVASSVMETGQAHSLLNQTFQVNVRRDDLLLSGEARGFGQFFAVLVNQRVAVPGQIGGGLARPGGGVEIGGDAFARLRGAQIAAILGLADGDVAGGQVEQNRRAGKRGVSAGRNGRPDILADFGVQQEAGDVLGFKDNVIAEGDAPAQQR